MTINNLVNIIQNTHKESEEYEFAFSDLFSIVYVETIKPKVRSFSNQLRGDIGEGESEASKLLMYCIEKWNGTGSFHQYYKASLDNGLINLVRKVNTQKRKHNTSYEVSLSVNADQDREDASRVDEVTYDEKLITTFEVKDEEESLVGLLSKFADKFPTESGLIDVMLSFSDDTKQAEKTEAYCKYYEVEKYTSAIQKRVSRARQAFKKFLDENNYSIV